MIHSREIARLKYLLKDQKPGVKAQQKMSPVISDNKRYYEVPSNANEAGVLLMLYIKNAVWYTALMKRTENHSDKHSGQISFPGGKFEKNDKNLEECALRETEEELGIPRSDIHLIGPLSNLYVFASNHLVYPFVGFIDRVPRFNIDKSEVDAVIEVPIDYFKEDIVKQKDLLVRGLKIPNVPYYDLYGNVLWGATAMMMSEFLNIWEGLND